MALFMKNPNKTLSSPKIIFAAIMLAIAIPCSTVKAMEDFEPACAAASEETSGVYDYELFKVVKRIRKIVDKEIRETSQDKFSVESATAKFPTPNSFLKQTTQGLFLCGYRELWTPWGTIKLTVDRSSISTPDTPWIHDPFQFDQKLFSHFEASFLKIIRDCYCKQPRCFVIKRGHNRPEKVNVTKDNLLSTLDGSKLKSNSFIHAIDCCPVYKIHSFEGYRLPEPELLDNSEYTAYKEVDAAWAAMEARFEREQKKTMTRRTMEERRA
jgi:hypothetical protein